MTARAAAMRVSRLGLLTGGVALLLAACSTNLQVRGNFPDPEVVAEIRPGVHGREEIASLLGSPSTVSSFRDDVWFYIGQRTSQFAFMKPDVLERRVLVVSFDRSGRVAEARTLTRADGRDIDPVARETPTEGQDLSLLQQLLGNVGRFDTNTGNNP